MFFNRKRRFRQDESETCCFEEFYGGLGTVLVSAKPTVFRIW